VNGDLVVCHWSLLMDYFTTKWFYSTAPLTAVARWINWMHEHRDRLVWFGFGEKCGFCWFRFSDQHQNQLQTSNDNAHARRTRPLCTLSLMARRVHQMPAECKLHGWSGNGTLLMARERGERRQDRPIVPIQGHRGTAAGTVLWFHVCQFVVVDWFDWRGGWTAWALCTRQTCIMTAQNKWAKRPSTRQRQADRHREGVHTTHAETNACGRWSITVTCSDPRPTVN